MNQSFTFEPCRMCWLDEHTAIQISNMMKKSLAISTNTYKLSINSIDNLELFSSQDELIFLWVK